jgi:putative endonuclease
VTQPKSSRETGVLGEKLGEEYLKKAGYKIIARNVRSPFGEIDIVAEHQKTLVFIEIKARRNQIFGLPEEAVGQNKKERLRRLGEWYLAQNRKFNSPARFDVLAVELKTVGAEFRLIQNAFEF